MVQDSDRGGRLGDVKRSANNVHAVVPWAARVLWIAPGAVAPWTAIGDGRSTSVTAVLAVLGWAAWGGVFLALLVPSALSLTVVRTVTPLVVVSAVWSGDPLSVALALPAAGLLWNASVADWLVQGGAYGAETRFCLRTPFVQALAAVPVWAVFAGCVLVGPLALAAGNPVLGVPSVLLAAVLARTVPARLHRMSRRWLVLVPAGTVVHDHLVLAETVMVRRANLAGVRECGAEGEAADLTGGTFGGRIEMRLGTADKVLLTTVAMRVLRTSQALHVQAFTVNPLRRRPALAVLTGGR
ncbi:MAG: hypothetical protein RLZZ305_764 [Actinomycetota bacterium]|jgi:hypothetical protein